jgi:DNA polymerase III epsilon subunit-like protein
MNKVVFDVESLAYPLESFEREQQEYLLRYATTEEERNDAILKMALSPFTAQILAVAMINPDSNQGKVFFQGPGLPVEYSADGLVEFVPLEESQILEEFWKTVARYAQFITFNGRMFDCPFLMLRSALLGVRPSRNLMPYRYSAAEHCDLLEQLTFYGAGRKFSLDFYCRSFGIRSPKAEGITGLDVGTLYQEGRYHDIAEYCLRDVRATAELYQRWLSLLAFEK